MGLYEEAEKPTDPLEFIKAYLGASAAAADQLKAENAALKKQVVDLQSKVAELEKRLGSA